MERIMQAVLPARLGRQFRLLLGASWITNLGDGIALAAGPLLIASQTRDPMIVALAPMMQQLPWLLFGLFAGAQADRVDRRRLVVIANFARAAMLAVLVTTIITGAVEIAIVLVVLFCFGVAETFADTTSSTLTPMLVGKDDLGVANARLFTGYITLNQLVGPPVGAFLFALGLAFPFVTELVCVLLGAMLVARLALPDHGRAPEERSHMRRDIAEGMRWLWEHPPVRTLALVIVSFNVTFGAAWSVLVLYATVHLHMGEIGFGLLASAAALGGLVGTSSYDWLERHVSLGTLMRVCLSLEVCVHLALALANRPWEALVVLFVFGAYAFVWGTLAQTVRQRAVPTEFQGRVGSVYLVGVYAGLVAGSALGGLIGRHFGITAPFWFAFAGTAVILALIWRQLPRIAHAD
ncbi:MAG: MFS transporter [Nocardioidaceae bacterium]